MNERGSALICVLIAAALLSALGAGLVTMGSTEAMIAANFRTNKEARYAAEAAAERAVEDLVKTANWSDPLSGGVLSTFVDSTLTPTLVSSQQIDLMALTATVQQRSDAAGSWGVNAPRWRLFAYGPLSAVTGSGAVQSPAYLVTWIADDPGETDGDPAVDSNGRITLLARALGLFGSTHSVQVTLSRSGPGPNGVRLLSWQEVE
jgi:type IV pilus assembly PilX-like protein